MPNGNVHKQVKAALDAMSSARSNHKALTYAPWVLSLMLIVFIREQASTFDVGDWTKVLAFVAILPFLGRFAQSQIDKQQRRAEDGLERLLASGKGLDELSELQLGKHYRHVKLSSRIHTAVRNAAMVREKQDNERRARRERERTSEPALAR